MDSGTTRANLTLSKDTVETAKELGLNLSQAAEAGIRAEISRVRAQQWLEEHQEAIEAYNERIEREGVPLAKYRMF